MTKFMVFLLSTLCASMVFGLSTVKPSRHEQDDFPPHDEYALVARYVMHHTNWTSVASISTMNKIKGFPFAALKSFCDGPDSNSTGIPYLYMTSMDVSGKDLEVNNNVTIMSSLAQLDTCLKHNYDPQDPRCPKTMISGKYVKVDPQSAEYTFAQNALFSRHPEMKWWPKGHEFYVAKIVPYQIAVLDYFGGIKYVTPEEYFHINVTQLINAYGHMFSHLLNRKSIISL